MAGNKLALKPDAAKQFAHATIAASTRSAYKSDWAHFEAWCASSGLAPLPAVPDTVAAYLADLADSGFKLSTIKRRLSTIGVAHRTVVDAAENPKNNFFVESVLKGIRRTIGTEQKQAKPLLPDDVKKILPCLGTGLRGTRDRSLITLGITSGCRGAELVGLDVSDVAFEREGLIVSLRSSKTDQEGHGRKIGIPSSAKNNPICPVRNMRAWLDAACIESGPVFRRVFSIGGHERAGEKRLTPHSVWLIVKSSCAAAGLNPDGYSAHSLRSGFVTSAYRSGKSIDAIKKQTGHRNIDMVFKYIRQDPDDLFTNNAAKGLL
jgi:integrase